MSHDGTGHEREGSEVAHHGLHAAPRRRRDGSREAPDFELEMLTAQGTRSGGSRRLADHRGRPVALIFGSYT